MAKRRPHRSVSRKKSSPSSANIVQVATLLSYAFLAILALSMFYVFVTYLLLYFSGAR